MYARTRSALIVFVVLAIGVAIFVMRGTNDGLKSYKNTVYGYAVTYPLRYGTKEYSDEQTVFGILSRDSIAARAQAQIITAEQQPGQNSTDAIAEQLDNICAAEGSNESFTCTDTLSTEPFTTSAGQTGYVLMLKGEAGNASTTALAVPMGPYYTFTLSRNGAISTVLVISPPSGTSAAQADAGLLQSIAQSITVLNK